MVLIRWIDRCRIESVRIIIYGMIYILYGTGMSIFLIDALRIVGIGFQQDWRGRRHRMKNRIMGIILGLSFMDRIPSGILWNQSKPASGGNDVDLWHSCQCCFCNECRVEGTHQIKGVEERSAMPATRSCAHCWKTGEDGAGNRYCWGSCDQCLVSSSKEFL